MKLQEPINSNYCATVVEIKELLPLENSDNLVNANLFGNTILVPKTVKIGDKGVFFPVETQLSSAYLSKNNLYRHEELNVDKTKKGYFDVNGRVRCVKLRGYDSEGMFMTLESLKTADFSGVSHLTPGDEFDHLDGKEVCKKFIPKYSKMPGSGNKGNTNNDEYESKVVDGQFNFHKDTAQLYKNIHKLEPDVSMHISYKYHGTSGISSKLLCKKQLSKKQKFFRWLGANINEVKYDSLSSSRTKLRNDRLYPDIVKHKSHMSTWDHANAVLYPKLQDGMTAYYEIIGYDPGGAMIQKGYDYGFTQPREKLDYKYGLHFGIVIYRVTLTNISGDVFEFTPRQVEAWTKSKGLEVPEVLYEGTPREFFNDMNNDILLCTLDIEDPNYEEFVDFNHTALLEDLKSEFTEKKCHLCVTDVPEEGVVIRLGDYGLSVFKLKSTKFNLRETKSLDKGEVDSESIN